MENDAKSITGIWGMFGANMATDSCGAMPRDIIAFASSDDCVFSSPHDVCSTSECADVMKLNAVRVG